MKTDVVIIGAGPAGIFTALEMLRRGGVHYENVRIEEEKRLDGITGRTVDLTITVRPAPGEPEIVLSPEDITLELAEALKAMEPFGEGNPEPVFGLKGVVLSDIRLLGPDHRHVSLNVQPCGLRAVWWNCGNRIDDLRGSGDSPRDISFRLAVSNYGERHVELRLESAN